MQVVVEARPFSGRATACGPGRSEAEAGVRHYLQISSEGAPEGAAAPSVAPSGAFPNGPVYPGFRFAPPGATILAAAARLYKEFVFYFGCGFPLCKPVGSGLFFNKTPELMTNDR